MNWGAMLLLGAYHGINPAMGWLFAVALGMQEHSARGVWRALPPMVLGHAAAVGAVVAAAGLSLMVVPPDVLRVLVASTLLALGLYQLWRHRHPRFGGMQVGFVDLTIWSFLSASAHGAGFMVLPFVMVRPEDASAAGAHAMHVVAARAGMAGPNALAVCLHSFAYFTVSACVAWIVYRKVGLSILRTAWFNVDWLWAAALVVTGIAVLLT